MAGQSMFRLSEIYLLESIFKRVANVDFKEPTFKNSANISVEHQVLENDSLQITVTLDFKAGKSRVKEISAKIKMIGIFICDTDPIIPIDQFAVANGPAIMFPFLREHLASITLKAGISPILLPSVNFIRLSTENKAKKKLPNA
ncbi:protein-export chaperone SecB [Mucilaginibacter sp.]|uniref:protein-export chaperone SecB n=1 Tax=Mucilaginibacter sp. TaxID=1882438 RepID=UPI0026292A58|nr:protein-export chaperone SecB [Mucilaginibacter sp.]MDB5032656.1 secB [Mucilaginibacter sp.]